MSSLQDNRLGTVEFEARPGQEINLDEIFGQARRPQHQNIRYELAISPKEASQRVKQTLNRERKRLEVKIPAGEIRVVY